MLMKLKVFFSAVLLLICGYTYSFAQQTIKPTKRLKGGLVLSKLHNTEWESSASPGFSFGISLDFRLSNAFSVQPEVLYHEKGGRERISSLDTEFDLTMDYIEVPLLAKYHLPAQGIVHPHLYLGSYAAFLIENHSNTELMNSDGSTPDKVINQAKDNDFGAVIGVGTDLNFAFNNMSAEIRYNAGLSDIFNDTVSQTIRNGSFSLMVGFSF